jgi:hypothetical protein
MRTGLNSEHKKLLDDLIFNHKYKKVLIEKTENSANLCMMNAFFEAGIVEFDEVIKSVWSIAKNKPPSSVEKDDKGYPGLVYIWKDISLLELLESLDVEEDEFHLKEGCQSGENVYFKIRHDPKRSELVIISLHIAKW